MSPPFLLRTDGQSLRTGTCIVVSPGSSKFGANAAHGRDFVAFFPCHDNASEHTAATTVDFPNESEVQLLPHPPYSPDLSLCDFFLFPEVKKQLKGTLFESAKDGCSTFTRSVEDIPKSTWAEEWNKWFHF